MSKQLAGASASIQQRVFDLVQSMIADGRIQPGETLLEARIARSFSVSRSPARHALEALCRAKLVRANAGRGYVVAGKPVEGARAFAEFEEQPLEAVARWERLYVEVEQQVCKCVLHRSVRVNEERLAGSFGVSRTVSRDALARLHSAGMVTKDRQGHWVAERITLERIRNIYEVRCLIEPVALVHAAKLISPTTLEAARVALREAIRHSADMDSKGHALLEQELHVTLLAACPNKELLRALDRTHLLLLSNHYTFYTAFDFSRRHLKKSLKEHLQVIEFLQAGKWTEAAVALEQHLRDSCEVWVERFESASAASAQPLPNYLSPLED